MVFPDNLDRKLKQTYLRENIMAVGYDPEDFCEFLESIREEGRIFVFDQPKQPNLALFWMKID